MTLYFSGGTISGRQVATSTSKNNMDQREKNIQIADAIDSAKSIAVVLSKNCDIDTFCAAIGLYFMLRDKAKTTDLLFQGIVPAECEFLLDKTAIKTNLGAKELVVSIDYASSPEAVAQYSTNNGVLYIKLAPVNRNFDINKVQTEIQGQSYDLIFTVGAQTPEQIGEIYNDMKQDFSRARVVNMDNNDNNQKYGFYNVVEPSEQSLSLLTLNTSRFWRLKVTSSSAKALLKGISHGMA